MDYLSVGAELRLGVSASWRAGVMAIAVSIERAWSEQRVNQLKG
jgi:hypothetical protein